jgi:hypothetical protein
MKTPKTTKRKPYIEFRFKKSGKLYLKASSNWWGGKNSGFVSSDGEGNTCLPEHLDSYIKAFKSKQIKEAEKEIVVIQKRILNLNAENAKRELLNP